MKNYRTVTSIVIALLCVALIGTSALALAEREDSLSAGRIGSAYGGAALGEFAMSLGELDETLQQCLYATDAPLLSSLCSRAAANAASALTAMSSLPYSTQELERMSGYINGTGDYLLYLSREAARGSLPDSRRRGELAELAGGISLLADGLGRILTEHSEGGLDMDEYASGADAGSEDTVGSELRALEESLPDFPRLEYDGEYSVSALEREARYLQDSSAVSEAHARSVAAAFLGVPQTRLTSAGLSETDVPCYGFTVSGEDGTERSIAVTERGGVVLALSCSRSPGAAALDLDAAAERAGRFLANRGWSGLESVSSVRAGDIGVVTFAAVQDGVLCLPDAVSVGVALDNGDICSFDATDYVMNHAPRSLPGPGVSAEDAALCLPQGVEAESSRLVLLETEGARELLAYEFACRAPGGGPLTIYASAADGRQIKIETGRS